MVRNIKRTKIEKKSIDEEAMRNAFNKVSCLMKFELNNSEVILKHSLFSQDENDEDDIRLESYVDRYFNDPNNAEKLQVIWPASLSDACRRLAENKDEDTASKIIE